ncbi:MAG: hypothetical protein A2381_09355 [Bdellovibrionales bacterium RIFOXYB1_FULL_37_110]|nr:MAG: hypothetical protein A2417_14395 [Bdellovibrionales bacterium RIFOXYC1_FULL_37_79]OFZ56884.1 MAG: hypothetical protein A2381_09355 [Bdellovibrionales bacterium RIFOXYB1_FULL_37_110]OFZ62170.1 MAG: hypothetical protein A2328_06880 [Bdellovibrionales bacterium RIFOXYB2_FULL_36_6]OFZ65570.1 MAG: hypothetical protein A2577_17310 [Bdellovibrionales bacterium RIFOXYD1_FULL_36_51]
MKKYLWIFFTVSLSANAINPVQLFIVQRSKNKNEVRYELRVDENCMPLGKEPVHGYWQELEKGPDVRSEMEGLDFLAYGIAYQKINGDTVKFKVKAIKDREYSVKSFKKADTCYAEATTKISGKDAILKKVYISSVEKFLKVKVKYINLEGVLPDGTAIQERMNF